MALFIKGYQVVNPVPARDGTEKAKPLSRLFTVRDAADQFCKLALAEHPRAYVRVVHGYEVGINNSSVRPI